ncbi:MAG: restriction endonuclease, partial [Anaerolineae bacterium]|nr:restriction endonuclease [Anaerolineae bacterium]
DARHLYRQIDRAHRDWTPAQIEVLANVARLYRGEEPENLHGSADLLAEQFPDGTYADVPGLCKVATLRDGDNGLYVSTGGFTNDAQLDAERAREPVTLLDHDGFIQILLENYEALAPEFKAKVRAAPGVGAGGVTQNRVLPIGECP